MTIELKDHLLNDGTALVLHGMRDLEDSDLAQLLQFTAAQRTRLTVVVLSHTKVTSACLQYLACLPHLRELYLNGTQISDEEPFELAGWPLEVVNLDNTRLGDKGIAMLSTAANLRVISLRNTQVTDRGVHLLGGFQRLREYHLNGAKVSRHAKCRLDNSITLAHLDWAKAVRQITYQIQLAVQQTARAAMAPGPARWVRGWML